MAAPARTVLVTGAGGQTGSIVVRKLLERASCKVKAMVRSTASEEKLREKLPKSDNLEVVHGDTTKPDTLAACFEGVDSVVIGTSAMPNIDKMSLAGVILTKVFTFGMVSNRPSFWFADSQSPEQVDWVGQRLQIDAAKKAGVKHIVLISSMAGTLTGHFLNVSLDKIVLWKRKAEIYLMKSGIDYTIIHPGGLLPHPGPKANVPAPGGKRQLFVAVDDELIVEAEKLKEENKEGEIRNQIPREDVAEICTQCLDEPTAKGRSFDLGSGAEGVGEIYNGDLAALLATLNGKNCNYDKPELPEDTSSADDKSSA